MTLPGPPLWKAVRASSCLACLTVAVRPQHPVFPSIPDATAIGAAVLRSMSEPVRLGRRPAHRRSSQNVGTRSIGTRKNRPKSPPTSSRRGDRYAKAENPSIIRKYNGSFRISIRAETPHGVCAFASAVLSTIRVPCARRADRGDSRRTAGHPPGRSPPRPPSGFGPARDGPVGPILPDACCSPESRSCATRS